jgi:RND family efflux transporter MFP subunit
MRSILKWGLPIVVLAAAVGAGRWIIESRPEAEIRPPSETPVAIDATRIRPSAFDVRIRTEGTVRPRTESTLIPQVAGTVTRVSASFRDGGFFDAGDVLLNLDDRDYELALASAEAQVAQAQSALEQELALAKVVEDDWKQLGKPAPALGLRKPQIAAARADLLSAQAQLERARIDLERTRIRAPYDGRVLEQNADVGQFVTVGADLGRIYATDYVEIRLPLSNRQLEFVDLPEHFRDDAGAIAVPRDGPAVVLTARFGQTAHQWQGRVVRAEGAIDTSSRQLYVVAQVDDPYARGPGDRPPLRIGQFVEADIAGLRLEDVVVLPAAALREGGEVLVVDDASRLQRRPVNVVWADGEQVVIDAGLAPGELVATTPMSVAANGTLVSATVDGQPPDRDSGDAVAADAASVR